MAVRPRGMYLTRYLFSIRRGRITKDKAKNTKLTCRNWECGVVLPVRKAKPTAAQGLDMFRERLPVPMKFPASRYGEAEEPWFFQER